MGFFITPVFAQEITNPSLIIDSIEVPAEKFNVVLRDTPIISLNAVHAISWQVQLIIICFTQILTVMRSNIT